MKKPLVIYIGGRPGAGKGTAVANFVQNSGYRVMVVETGHMIREYKNSNPKSQTDKDLLQMINENPRGKLQPDSVIFELITRKIGKEKEVLGYDVLIFDGVPRTEMQARWLERFLSRSGLTPNLVFELQLSREEAISRMETRATEAGEKARPEDKDVNLRILRQDEYDAEVGDTFKRFNGRCRIEMDGVKSKAEVARVFDDTVTAFMNFRDSF